MAMVREKAAKLAGLEKCPTGISGLDEITGGGLPKGRPTLVVGSAGSGKTLLSMEFLIKGATKYNEPGVFVAFEETSEELSKNVASLGFDVQALIAKKKLAVDYVYIERSEIEETGEYDLEGLFIRLGHAIKSVGAKRVVLDTIEVLFAGLPNPAILRAELRRLFRWLKRVGVTAVITGERGEHSLTRYGLEEYVADCVILLDHRVTDQLSTRRLRVVKYRGSAHGTNEYPFLIDEHGMAILPITSLGLSHEASTERVPTGIPRLDRMFEGGGYYRGSSVLVSGTAGTGKTSLAAYFGDAACRSGKRCLYFAFEESESQLARNMRSIGLDMAKWSRKGLLKVHASRPEVQGLERHLVEMHKLIEGFKPQAVVVDPITNLVKVGGRLEVTSMLTRLVDYLKSEKITLLSTSLVTGETEAAAGVSSLMDTWINLQDMESNGERNRGIMIMKSRGMGHSNQVREFCLTDRGIVIADPYLGPSGIVTGSARAAREVQEEAALIEQKNELNRKKRELERKRRVMQAKVEELKAGFEAEREELERIAGESREKESARAAQRGLMARMRMAD
ncbi:MAG TPA: circadian clock protein KaiC [Syntrophales bacterium]|nr:circadian clock protein KaiC [Syntrophales bacterium]